MDERAKPSPQEARCICAIAECHQQTLDRYLADSPGQPTTRRRIENAIISLGLNHLLDRDREAER